jgi:PAS domain S-box-containing protein
MPLKRKLVLYMVVPAVLLLVVGATGLYALRRLERAADDILSDNYRTIREARSLERWLREIEEPAPESHPTDLARLVALVDGGLGRCEANITEDAEREVLEDLGERWRLVSGKLLDDRPEAPARRTELLAPLFDRVRTLISINERAMFDFERAERRIARLMLVVVAVASALALAALAVFARLAAARISQPILEVADDLHRALESPVASSKALQGDEIARLRFELKDLLARLRRFEDDQARQVATLRDRFALVMEEVRDGLVLLDTEHRILALNRVARRVLGLDPGTESNRHIQDTGLDAEVWRTLRDRLEEPRTEALDVDGTRTEIHADTRIYRPRLLPIRTAHDESEALLFVLWDVTEEMRFEEARRSFIGMLSHQLKTPLTSISMSISLLVERFRGHDAESDDLLSMAKADCASLSQLVSDLIDASRDAATSLTLAPRRTDVLRLLRHSVKPFLGQARERGIELRDELGSGSVFARVDPVKFPWVVTNILGNALRYTPRDGSVTLRLRVDGSRMRLSIADTGKGIAPDDLPKIFTPFASFDVDPEPSTHGLGLAVAREIIDAHGGTIRVESRLGEGTCFHIAIPRKESPEP